MSIREFYNISKEFLNVKKKSYKICCSGDPWASCLILRTFA